jgi:hypothetical protein
VDFPFDNDFFFKDVTACCENLLILQGSSMDYNIIFKCRSDLLMFQKFSFAMIFYSSYLHKKKKTDNI